MRYSGYINTTFGKFKVSGYNVDKDKEVIELYVTCGSCGGKRSAKIVKDKITDIRCYNCGSRVAVIPIKTDKNGVVVDTKTVGGYRYKKLHSKYNKMEVKDISEIQFMLESIQEKNGDGEK